MEKLNLETTKEQLESIFLVLKENIPQSKGIDEYGSLIVSTLQPVIGNFNFTILMMNPTDKFLPDKPVFRYLINPTHSVDTISPRAARLRISESILLFRLLEKCEPQFFSSVDYLVETEKPNFLTFPASSLFFLPLYDEKPAFGYILLWALETDGFIDYTEDQLEFLQKVVTTSMPILRSFYYREIGFATTEYFNQLFSRAKDLVFVLKDDGTIINVNKVVESILGYVPFDIIGHPFSKFIKTPINLDRSLDLEEYQEVEFYSSSEDLVPMEINFWSQAEMGKKPIYFMLARDLTLRNQVILDKIQQERLEAFALLSGGIAHDFNNYLSIIQGNISILDFYVRENMLDEGRDDVADIVSNVQSVIEQSKGLTKQLQSFSRTTLLQRKQINLDTLLSQIGKFMLTGTDIKLIYEYNSLNMFIEGDETMLSQVFTNLFINAREALEGRTEKIIELRVVDQDEAYLKIRVLDNGSGISEEDLPKVFEPFFSKKATGSGLGLSICQQIITEHGGNITVESMEDQFAEFIITLPISKVDSIDESDLADLPDIDPMDIWVMDDVPEIRRTLQHILELHGQRVECFATGEDLLKRLSRSNGPPQLLILDLTNKIGWGGHKTYSTLVEDQKLVIPTIFISGYSLEEFNLEQFGTNPVEFLHKPINEKLVLSTISKMIST